jgi:aminodeoxyfutalosine deaminase
VTLNSDDPAFFGSDVANEYLLAHTEQGFTREELRQLAANSIMPAFFPIGTSPRGIELVYEEETRRYVCARRFHYDG